VTRVLVTGAGGMLGLALRRAGHDVLGLTRAELDITDAAQVASALAGARPGSVVNCAAWTDVDGAESEPEGAHAVNALGAGILAQACAASGVHLLHISTDYVFDGRGTRPYIESDSTGPRSVYGQSKLEGERLVAAASPGHLIVRASWVFGEGGRNFVDTMLGLGAERSEVGVVTDQLGCPTWTGHLAPALLELAERRASGVYHVAGDGSCSWNELAVEVFAQAHVDCRVLPALTDATARPAPRPAYSVLGSERPDAPVLAPWREGVRGHLLAGVRA
jgi:dTDP-4-dehydrorhamnose reductase